MKIIKTLLILSLVIGLSFSLLGCKLLPWGDSAVEETTTIAALPGWLTLAHRAEAAEEPEVDEEEATEEEEETAEAPAQTATTQPATTQPATTQPAQTEQPAQTGTPRWQQPGTMEYIAKMRLDQAVSDYKRLLATTTSDMKPEARNEHKAKLAAMKAAIDEVAKGLGLDVSKEYGLSASSTDSGLGSGDWFHDMDSPSGWGN
jgi:septal ring-binding cell division protein DamX